MLGLQALPSICWLPLALLWFGLSETAILFVVVVGSLLSITVATESGVRNVPPLYLRAAQTMGARGATLYLRVILPAALPAILSGMRARLDLRVALADGRRAALRVGRPRAALATGRELGDMARVMAVMVAIVTLGLVTEVFFFQRLDARVREVWGTDRT